MTNSGKGKILVKSTYSNFELKLAIMSDYTIDKYKRIRGFTSLVKDGRTECWFDSVKANSMRQGFLQTADSSRYTVSWTYHPDNGLEVMYEKK